jgi:hypothetical protein
MTLEQPSERTGKAVAAREMKRKGTETIWRCLPSCRVKIKESIDTCPATVKTNT